jgi:hypothetical protein
MHAAVVTTFERPHPTSHRVAVMPFVATATPGLLVVLGAARDGAVSVNDERARTGHGAELTARS